MDYPDFELLAREIFASIPEEYRDGVDGLEVQRATVAHPSLPEVYTLGECKSESYPSEFGGPGEVRSVVVLYYGSFLALSRIDDDWDWEHELYETITHEIQHHLEALAAEDTLDELDYAEDQNFARREGERFDPYFYRTGIRVGDDIWEVDRDRFVEVPVRRGEIARGSVAVEWEGREYRLPVAHRGPDINFVRLVASPDASGEVYAVLVRRRGLREWIRALVRPSRLEVRQSDADVEAQP